MREIALGLLFALAGAIGIWGGWPEHKAPNGEPSDWALRARAGFWLFFLIGLFVAIRETLQALGLVER